MSIAAGIAFLVLAQAPVAPCSPSVAWEVPSIALEAPATLAAGRPLEVIVSGRPGEVDYRLVSARVEVTSGSTGELLYAHTLRPRQLEQLRRPMADQAIEPNPVLLEANPLVLDPLVVRLIYVLDPGEPELGDAPNCMVTVERPVRTVLGLLPKIRAWGGNAEDGAATLTVVNPKGCDMAREALLTMVIRSPGFGKTRYSAVNSCSDYWARRGPRPRKIQLSFYAHEDYVEVTLNPEARLAALHRITVHSAGRKLFDRWLISDVVTRTRKIYDDVPSFENICLDENRRIYSDDRHAYCFYTSDTRRARWQKRRPR
jgi:hypothetical protein